ncbi:MAG: hypothetical protein J6A21_03160 [Lentisphaeria bacterium]|nr:hypothetical protein [Lentisphaeria bacterium]
MAQSTDSWSEFDWENAFKADDARVHLYMRELFRFIDLPAEDDLILRSLTNDPEYRKIHDPALTEKLVRYFRKKDAEGDGEDLSWQKRDGAASFMLFSRLARLWAQEFALAGNEPSMPFMRIGCTYGQLLLQSSDLMELREDDPRSRTLKASIAKRMLSRINFLCGELSRLGQEYPAHEESCQHHFECLMESREKIIAFLFRVRKET